MRRSKRWFSSIIAAATLVALIPVSALPAFAAVEDLVINEVDADQTSTDTAEFVEIYDGGDGNTSLDGHVLVLFNGSNDTSYGAWDLDGLSTDADGYFVFCNDSANVPNCDLSAGVSDNLIQNGADAVALYVADDTDFPNGTAITVNELKDVLVYDTNDADDAGLLALLNPSQPQVNEDGGIDKDIESNQRCPDGAGGQRNTDMYTQATPTPGTENCVEPPTPVADHVVINEVDADQTSTDSAEFVEIYDGGVGNTALDGLVVVFYNGSDDQSYDSFDLDGQTTGADGYFVLCGDSSNVANCDLDVSPDTNLIQNGADAVAIHIGDAADFPNDTPLTTTDLVDAMVYDTNDADDAGLAPLLVGGPQLNEAENGDATIDSNGRCPDGAGGQRNTSSYQQGAPTPGAANTCVFSEADVIINEVDADQDSTDTAEFVELYDGGDGNTLLDGHVLVFFNGNGDTAYEAFDLDGNSTNADGYFVLCGDAANVENCDLDVTPNSNLIQNGADAVALYEGDAADFPDGTGLTTDGLLDALVYGTNDADDPELLTLLNAGQPQVNDNTTQSMQRCPNGEGGALNTDTYTQFAPTPGEENCVSAGPFEVFIHEVQGSGDSSPLEGDEVIVEGVVVGDFQGSDGLRGFYLQEEDADADADATTSEGVFVFDNSGVDVAIGDTVKVQGFVVEFSSETQIDENSVMVTSAGTGTLDPSVVTTTVMSLPVADTFDYEALEGMAVTYPQDLYIVEYFNFDRFGEVQIASERLFQPTAVAEPGSAEEMALTSGNPLARIILDDGRSGQNPDPARHPNGMDFSLTNTFRGGDTLANVTGVLTESSFGVRIHPTEGADHTATNPRPAAPDDVGGRLQVATFNVLNYFSTIDTGAPICGPLEDQGCRGADSAEEFTRQRDKIINAINTIDADVVGLMEIENHPTNAALQDLVDGLNAVAGAGTYDYVGDGPAGPDVIRVGIIYKPGSVTPVGDDIVLDDPGFLAPLTPGDDKNRAAHAQLFEENGTGEQFSVVVNHLKSKGSACGAGDDDPVQGNCNGTREAAAIYLANWIDTDPYFDADSDVMVIGDLNAYDKEDPIDALVAAGYTDLVFDYQGEFAYSYLFGAAFGYLDYAMANASLSSQVTGATVWTINADEPDILDYQTEFRPPNQVADLYDSSPYRSSDHDPIVVGLDLDQTPPEVEAEFDKIFAGYFSGLFEVEYSCTDNVDPDPTCVGYLNGISVDDGQLVYLIKSHHHEWHGEIFGVLFVKAPSFLLEVTGVDDHGNVGSDEAVPEFRRPWWWRWR